LKTFTAKDGTALRGTEGDGGLLSASRAGGLGLDLGVAVVLSGRRRRAENRDPLGLTSLATLGLVLELLVVKEKLFSGGENKITPTVDTLQHLVLKFHLRMAPFSPFPRAHPRGKNCGGRREYRSSTSPSYNPWTRPVTLLERSVGTNYRAWMPEDL